MMNLSDMTDEELKELAGQAEFELEVRRRMGPQRCNELVGFYGYPCRLPMDHGGDHEIRDELMVAMVSSMPWGEHQRKVYEEAKRRLGHEPPKMRNGLGVFVDGI